MKKEKKQLIKIVDIKDFKGITGAFVPYKDKVTNSKTWKKIRKLLYNKYL